MARSIVEDIQAVGEKIPPTGEITYPDLYQQVMDDQTIESKKEALLRVLQGGQFNLKLRIGADGKNVTHLSRKGGA